MGDLRMTVEVRRSSGGLGRGLASLIPAAADDHPREILIAELARNPYQPRHRFEADELERLAASIREHGVLQPVLVTQRPDGYELVAGERRVRAAELAGLDRVPAVIRTVDQQEQLALALVENLQRADLNAMDEARAFRQLSSEFGLTQEEIAIRVGRSRPAITNTLRLLEAAPAVQEAVEDGRISEGHARAMVGAGDHAAQEAMLGQVLARGLNVRQTEALVRDARPPTGRDGEPPRDPEVDRLEAGLRAALGTKVTLAPGRRGGRITIEYYDLDDLERLYDRLAGEAR